MKSIFKLRKKIFLFHPKKPAKKLIFLEDLCQWSAKWRHFRVLKWARKNGCDWNAWTCTYAAENGHLEMLQWAHRNGCHWDYHTCARAARNGHLDILQWARANGCPW